MKFKYIGQEIGNVSFANAGIIEHGELMKPNKVYEVPDDDVLLIDACVSNGAYVEVKENKKSKKGE